MIRYFLFLALTLSVYSFADDYRDHLVSEKNFLQQEINKIITDDYLWGGDENLYFTMGRYIQVSADLDAYDSGIHYDFAIP